MLRGNKCDKGICVQQECNELMTKTVSFRGLSSNWNCRWIKIQKVLILKIQSVSRETIVSKRCITFYRSPFNCNCRFRIIVVKKKHWNAYMIFEKLYKQFLLLKNRKYFWAQRRKILVVKIVRFALESLIFSSLNFINGFFRTYCPNFSIRLDN